MLILPIQDCFLLISSAMVFLQDPPIFNGTSATYKTIPMRRTYLRKYGVCQTYTLDDGKVTVNKVFSMENIFNYPNFVSMQDEFLIHFFLTNQVLSM